MHIFRFFLHIFFLETRSMATQENLHLECLVSADSKQIFTPESGQSVNMTAYESVQPVSLISHSSNWAIFHNKGPRAKKGHLKKVWHLSIICHLGDIFSVFGAEQFQFPCRVIFDNFCSNWFKLVFAHPPNSQTFNNKNIVVSIIKTCWWNISSFFDNVYRDEGHMGVDITVMKSWKMVWILPKLQLWLRMVDFLWY